MEVNLQSKTGLAIRCDSTYEPVAEHMSMLLLLNMLLHMEQLNIWIDLRRAQKYKKIN